MKARDPSIKIVINGHSKNDWNEPLLRIAGEHADAFQFHLYRAPRINNYSTLQGRPRVVTIVMRQIADGVPDLLGAIQGLMKKYLGRTLPIIISEFGMGDTRNREFMTSVASSVMLADIWRTLAESPAVIGANKWCLFTGDWSQIQGPTFAQPDTSYYNRPEHAVHVIYARCRGEMRLAVNNDVSEGARVVVFKRADSYGLVLISREAVSWQSVVVDLPGAKRGIATCLLMTAGHPFLGNENDNALVGMYEFEFDYEPGQPVFVPSNSVMGLIVPK